MTSASQTILVFTNDSGMGHRRAALATVAALEKRYGEFCRPILVNPLEEPDAPTALRNLQSEFNRVIRQVPGLYSLGHGVSNSYLPTRIIEQLEIRFLNKPIDHILGRTRPDVIVTTHPTFIYLLVNYRQRENKKWPLVVLTTDLARLQRLWFRKEVDLYLVPTDEAAQLAVRRGIRPDRIHVTGIPVDLRLADSTSSKTELRAAYGWNPNLPTFLAAGSRRVHKFQSFLRALNDARLPIQLVVVTGDDEALLTEVRTIEWQIPVHIYGYIDDFPDRVHAADAIITKAGGLSVAESLASGTPLFIIQSTPMHEQGNADYVVAGGAGIRTENPAKLVAAVRDSLADNCRRLAEMTENARRLGHPRAAYDVADRLWALTGGSASTSLQTTAIKH